MGWSLLAQPPVSLVLSDNGTAQDVGVGSSPTEPIFSAYTSTVTLPYSANADLSER